MDEVLTEKFKIKKKANLNVRKCIQPLYRRDQTRSGEVYFTYIIILIKDRWLNFLHVEFNITIFEVCYIRARHEVLYGHSFENGSSFLSTCRIFGEEATHDNPLTESSKKSP